MAKKKIESLRLVRLDQFAMEQEEVDWLIKDLLPTVGWTLFVGMKGLGKTTFCLQLADAVVNGKPFLGMPTKQGRVLYYQADSQPIEWREIVKRVVGLQSKAFSVVNIPSKSLNNDGYYERMAFLAEQVQPELLIFDSLYELTSANINSEQLLLVINKMNTIAKCGGDVIKPYILIHHPPHESTRAAGSSVLGNNCSNEWHLLAGCLDIVKGRLVKSKKIYISRNSDTGNWELGTQRTPLTDQYPILGGMLRKDH